ncbi:MAG: multicopper oxidase domain-containing protein [Chloroflexi bacterium]|nr:multicopper oxidase domain-containing protein [Chloroflexota bacterium]
MLRLTRVVPPCLALLGGAALLAGACAPSTATGPLARNASAPPPTEVRLGVAEWKFDRSTFQLPAGRPVTLVLENTGHLEHDLNVAALGVHLVVQPGQAAQQTLNLERAGTYEFECSLPGHKEAGMKGTLTVGAPTDGAGAEQPPAAAPASSEHASHAALAPAVSRGNQVLTPRLEGDVKVFDLRAQHVRWEVLPGQLVDAYAYEGQVPGPVLRVTEGDKLRVNFTNELPEATVLHFHGPSLPNAMDGVPGVTQEAVPPGGTFSYEFTAQPAGIFLYHTHLNSAVQEPKGLYGLFVVEPKGEATHYDRDVYQVLSEHSGYFLINGKAFPQTEPITVKKGERVRLRLANLGQVAHPMHLHGHAFKVVATDGYLVRGEPLTKDTINIAPGERYDLEFVAENPGTWVFHCHLLSHVTNNGVEPGGMITVIKVEE